jgi:hypothetical protein
MNSRTLNPFAMLGSYLGFLIGGYLSLKGYHLFWWLPGLLNVNITSQILVDAAGGFFAGYILQILFRVFKDEPDKK